MRNKSHFYLFVILLLSFVSCKDEPKAPEDEYKPRTAVEMVTNYGTMVFELYDETPLHRDNFIKLVNEKAYDSLLFHRVIEGFMIQGGDPESKNAPSDSLLGNGDLGYTVKAEFHPNLFHQKGALATAREDNRDRGSSAIQFYVVQGKVYNDSLLDKAEQTINERLARYYVINDERYKSLWDSLQKAIKDENEVVYERYNDRLDSIVKTYKSVQTYKIPETQRMVYKTQGGTPTLDQNYTVFGQVIKGIKVVDSIAAVKTDANDRPIQNVRILSVRLLDRE
ncbi:peptidylprolyl isomerase [Subsaxibacter sp. CAU 1640]|uniref:peptidylprolyl isomerase n=1 Tax=Subsaxibacter sp. CAU 1640 TaxID=2933271 RepID=UPI002006C808|nr:peptidylprolyl isomerase [Subsaxibacter sp. CAU 1640]MCK7591789.1 peptidylprolyl isomerase [Subsaxibacter sp. CAU 1640]